MAFRSLSCLAPSMDAACKHTASLWQDDSTRCMHVGRDVISMTRCVGSIKQSHGCNNSLVCDTQIMSPRRMLILASADGKTDGVRFRATPLSSCAQNSWKSLPVLGVARTQLSAALTGSPVERMSFFFICCLRILLTSLPSAHPAVASLLSAHLAVASLLSTHLAVASLPSAHRAVVVCGRHASFGRRDVSSIARMAAARCPLFSLQ